MANKGCTCWEPQFEICYAHQILKLMLTKICKRSLLILIWIICLCNSIWDSINCFTKIHLRLILLFKNVCWLISKTKRLTETENTPVLLYFPNAYNGQGWIRTRNGIQELHPGHLCGWGEPSDLKSSHHPPRSARARIWNRTLTLFVECKHPKQHIFTKPRSYSPLSLFKMWPIEKFALGWKLKII